MAARSHLVIVIILVTVGSTTLPSRGDADSLYGVHWWGYTVGQPIDTFTAAMLDCPAYSAWDVETIITHSADHWKATAFTGLYQGLHDTMNVTVITRVDYNWGETVPNPSNPDYASWPSSVVGTVNTLKNWSHIWIIGNEPNVTVEGNNWPNNRIPPADYATIYRNVRSAIHSTAQSSPAGEHQVLIAGPSPGGVAGERWMAGPDYLAQVIAAIPNNEIDGVALHAYGFDVPGFHWEYESQLNVIDAAGLEDVPVYITEWNTGGTEADRANHIRGCFADLNAWNATPGNHNIRCLCWFIYDYNQQAGGGWYSYSIEYWSTTGEPLGTYYDPYTAFSQTVDLRYPAGLVGTRATAPEIQLSPVSISRTVCEGDTLDPDTFTVTNIGGGTLTYAITESIPWLSVSPLIGQSTGESDLKTITYDVDDEPVGDYRSGLIVVSSNDPEVDDKQLIVWLKVDPSPYALADFDRDWDVDSDDFDTFQRCLTGADLGPPAEGCDRPDIDDDGDVDQHDFGKLQRCFTGTGVPAPQTCAD